MRQKDPKQMIASPEAHDAEALAALVDAQLEEVVCGGWSKLTWTKVNPN